MKRLWVRLGIAAGALAFGSSGAYYGVQSFRQPGDTPEQHSQSQTEDAGTDQTLMPVPDEGGPGFDDGQVQPAGLELPAPDTIVRANDESDAFQPYGQSTAAAPAQPSAAQPDSYGAQGATGATASLSDDSATGNAAEAQYQSGYEAQAQYQPQGQFAAENPYQPQGDEQSQGEYQPQAQYGSQPEQASLGQYQNSVADEAGSQPSYLGASGSQGEAAAQMPAENAAAFQYQASDASQAEFQAGGDTQNQPQNQLQPPAQAQFQPQGQPPGFSSQQSVGDAEQPATQYDPRSTAASRGGSGAAISDTSAAGGFGGQSQFAAEAAGTAAASQYGSSAAGGLVGSPPAAAQAGQLPADSSFGRTDATQPNTQFQQFASQPAEPAQPAVGLSAAAAGAAQLVSHAPGAPKLEGAQSPSVTLEKLAPEEIQVGKPAQFQLRVQNVGQATAHDVVITDAIPLGTEFIRANPQAAQGGDRLLTWQLGALEPGDEATVTLELLPQTEGEIGSVAQVGFQTQASVRTRCTKPMLTVGYSAPEQVLSGQEAIFTITIANPGSGAATGVVLEADIPEGLSHEAGRALEKGVGTLAPGEELSYELALRAGTAGLVTSKIRVVGDGNLAAAAKAELEVVAPQLQVGIGGPKVRFLERQVTYEVAVMNPGTAPAKNVDLVTYLPKGLQFVSADNKGRYVEQDHAVAWNLEELPEQTSGKVRLTALPVEIGEQQLWVQAKAGAKLNAEYKHTTRVEGIVELSFTLADLQDPIEVGSETTYEIRIVNQGSEVATNVVLAAQLPPPLTPLSADGATRGTVQGQTVHMEPLERLAPQANAVYRIKVKGQQAGDHVINVQLTSDGVKTPVVKQEITKVYADR